LLEWLTSGAFVKIFQALGAVAVTMMLAVAPGRAVTVTTTGCFDGPCTAHHTASDDTLRFTGHNTSSESEGNLLLGSLTLSNSSLFGGHIFNGDTFDLTVAFGSPIGTTTDVADLTGFITVLGGIVGIDFSPETFLSTDGNTYHLSVNDVILGTNFFHGRDTESLTGTLSMTAAVPEPATWAMMILGFAGIGFMAYRRRSSATLQAA
jgi:hypothetical protein